MSKALVVAGISDGVSVGLLGTAGKLHSRTCEQILGSFASDAEKKLLEYAVEFSFNARDATIEQWLLQLRHPAVSLLMCIKLLIF